MLDAAVAEEGARRSCVSLIRFCGKEKGGLLTLWCFDAQEAECLRGKFEDLHVKTTSRRSISPRRDILFSTLDLRQASCIH